METLLWVNLSKISIEFREHMVFIKHMKVPTDTIQYPLCRIKSTNFSVAKLKDAGSLQSNGKGTCERRTYVSVKQGRSR